MWEKNYNYDHWSTKRVRIKEQKRGCIFSPQTEEQEAGDEQAS